MEGWPYRIASSTFTGPEQRLVEYIDRHKMAVDLISYGDAPNGLEPGTSVRVCMPRHHLQGMLGMVTASQRSDGRYAITVFRGRETYFTFLNPIDISTARIKKNGG